jgi:hypothetical protein
MDCGQIQASFTSYQDQELDRQHSQLFEHHLANCPRCAREWHDFLAILRQLDTVPRLPPPPDLLPGIYAKLEHRSFGQTLSQALARIFSPLPLTAAASGMAVILLTTILTGPGSIPGIGKETAPSTERRELPEALTSITPPPATSQLTMIEAAGSGLQQPGGIHLLSPMTFTPLGRPGQHGETEISPHHSYYHYLAAREQIDPATSYFWQHVDPVAYNFLNHHNHKPRIGTPLQPDVTIRVQQLSPEELDRLHNHIQKAGNWQTRCYHHAYLLVLLNPGELEALLSLLERHRLPFFSQVSLEAGRSPHQMLLVAIRP